MINLLSRENIENELINLYKVKLNITLTDPYMSYVSNVTDISTLNRIQKIVESFEKDVNELMDAIISVDSIISPKEESKMMQNFYNQIIDNAKISIDAVKIILSEKITEDNLQEALSYIYNIENAVIILFAALADCQARL